ncbi:MAG: glycosyltransferase family 2 protein [Fibrobacter sp.]|uniref:glycosyltransferase family A protein n=1 Tax=Fibrobacter sp. TaxID=35828 RepID=UPI001B28E5A5|nr:glycosyltransferase family 2 protein [Fibrobacter sp.]MBO7061539.1 glycosyltransferase family 2 protein [Fibrobacter sp.]
MKNLYITIFTPTYNRRQLIERLYQSLLSQTQKNFEWLVVDDGSTDDTENFFEPLLSEQKPFPIRYIKQKNGGKHRAINNGVKKASGELFFIVDSDDYLTENAIEKINQWMTTLDGSHKWAGIAGLRGQTKNRVLGQYNSSSKYIDAKNSERRKYNLLGDKAEVYFTDVLKKYPFPEISGENFISEEIVWNAIARDGYCLRWFNEIIYICDYLDGGLTKDNSKDQNNPQGRLLWAKGQLETFPNSWRDRFLAIGIYRHSVRNAESLRQTANKLDVSLFLVIFASMLLSLYSHIFSN